MTERSRLTPSISSALEPANSTLDEGSAPPTDRVVAKDGRAWTEISLRDPGVKQRVGLLLVLLAATLYIPTLSYDFVWDDFLMVVQNQYFKHVQFIRLYFTSDFGRLTSGGLPAVYFRPLFALSFLMDYRLWGNNPAGYHFTNLLLYIGTVYLAYRVARCLFADARVALGATLLFTVHPAHVEPVAFISARPDILAAIGMLVAILGYRLFGAGTGLRRWVALAGSLLGFAFGLFSKEMAISLPVLLVWYELVLGSRGTGPTSRTGWFRLLPILPYFAIGAGFLWYRWGAVQSLAPSGLGVGILWQRLPGALEVLSRYTVLAVWPFRMQAAYTQARPESLLNPWPLAGLTVAAMSLLLVVAWRRRWPEAVFALGWFLLALAPVIDLVPLAPRAVNMADRYLFIPSLGICWLLALAGISLWDRYLGRSRRIAVASGVAVACLLLAWTGSTLGYSAVWRDNLALFDRMVGDLPDAALGYHNLGLALARAGRVEEAIRALETAVRLDPNDVRSQLSLARTYVESGRTVEGFRILDRLELRASRDKMYFLVRARAHMAVNEWDAAFTMVSRALQQFPDLAEGYQVLGFVQERRGSVQEARDAYRQAVRLSPDLPWSYLGLARIQLQLGELGEAASAARAAVRLDSSLVAAWQILALALEQMGDVAGSRQAWKRVLELDDVPEGIAEARRHLFIPGALDGRRPSDSP